MLINLNTLLGLATLSEHHGKKVMFPGLTDREFLDELARQLIEVASKDRIVQMSTELALEIADRFKKINVVLSDEEIEKRHQDAIDAVDRRVNR